MKATGSRRTRRRTMSSNDSAASMSRPCWGFACSAARSTSSTEATNSSASSRGVSTPAASNVSTASARASRSGEVPPAKPPSSASGRLGLEFAAALVRRERVGELVQLTLQHGLEIVCRVLDPVVGDPTLGKVVCPHLLGALARADLGAAVRRKLGLLLPQRVLVQARAQHAQGALAILQL